VGREVVKSLFNVQGSMFKVVGSLMNCTSPISDFAPRRFEL
jgi:hypothetical protein